jgi:lipopolysaccharide export system protein LptA
VKIVQGTLNIDADRAVVTLKGTDPVHAVLTGDQAVLRQQMDNGTPMTARADRIDYDMVTDIVVLTGNYTVTTQRGSTSGQRLTYNMKTGQVDSGGQDGGRVKVRILPKSQRTQD